MQNERDLEPKELHKLPVRYKVASKIETAVFVDARSEEEAEDKARELINGSVGSINVLNVDITDIEEW